MTRKSIEEIIEIICEFDFDEDFFTSQVGYPSARRKMNE